MKRDIIPDRFEASAITALRREVVADAKRLVELTRERLPGWAPPPFEPNLLAETLRIPVVYSRKLGVWDALIHPTSGGGFRILVSDNVRSAGRKNFSICHELAHTFLPDAHLAIHHRSANRAGCDRNSVEERLCDLGASEMLMPGDCYADSIAEFGLRASALPKLADRFAVSWEAAAVRLVETSAVPCAAGFFTYGMRPAARDGSGDHKRPADSELHYRSHRVFHSERFPYLFPKGKSVPDSSVVYRAFAGDTELSSVEEFNSGGARVPLRVTAFPTGRYDKEMGAPVIAAVLTVEGDKIPA